MKKMTCLKRMVAFMLTMALVFTTGAFDGLAFAEPVSEKPITLQQDGYTLTFELEGASDTTKVALTDCSIAGESTLEVKEIVIPNTVTDTTSGKTYKVSTVKA